MTDSIPLPLSRDDIRNAFLREAEAATEQIVGVSEKLTHLRSCEDALRSAYADYTEAHRQAVSNPVVSAKLTELAIPSPGSLSVTIGAGAKATPARKPARKARSSAGKTNAAATASAGGASGAQSAPGSESEAAVGTDRPQ